MKLAEMLPNGFLPIRGYRRGDIIVIPNSANVYHRDLYNKVWGTDLEPQDIKERLKANPDDQDMMMVFNSGRGAIEIEGDSSQLEFPLKEMLPELRKKTLELLRQQYPDDKFVDKTKY